MQLWVVLYALCIVLVNINHYAYLKLYASAFIYDFLNLYFFVDASLGSGSKYGVVIFIYNLECLIIKTANLIFD